MKKLILISLFSLLSLQAYSNPWHGGNPPGQQEDDSPGNSEHDHKNDAPLPYSFVLVLVAVALGFALTRKNKTV